MNVFQTDHFTFFIGQYLIFERIERRGFRELKRFIERLEQGRFGNGAPHLETNPKERKWVVYFGGGGVNETRAAAAFFANDNRYAGFAVSPGLEAYF